jgi:O-methyltransferase
MVAQQQLAERAKRAIRDSTPIYALQKATAGLFKRWPIERVPWWLGKLHQISVPRGVVPNKERSPLGAANISNILELLKRTMNLTGDIAECGVYRGGTLIPIAYYVKQHRIQKKVVGFDSFEGFGSSIHFDLSIGGLDGSEKRVGGFGDTSYTRLREKIDYLGLKQYVELVPGYFEKTLPLLPDQKFCFVHLDCDTHDSYRCCLEFFYPRVVSGGIILLDEYNDPFWPGCNLAVDNFLANKPERLQEISMDNYLKYFVQKVNR